MKTKSTKKLSPWLLAIAIAGGASACGRDISPAAADHETRPSLKLAIDNKPIDRDAADRVSYAPVVKKTVASVVHVYSSKQIRREDLAPLLNDPILRQFLAIPGLTDALLPRQQHGLGSGVVITKDGHILTSNHVVDGADEVKVSIGESEERHDATIIGSDSLADVAVLKIEATNLAPATFGDSDQLQVGDVVLAIGNPFAVGQSVSRGIVSAVGRGNLGIEAIEDFIQTDAAINQGNSGGALVDSMGRVVGINTAIATGTGGFAGVGFAVPINLARDVAEQIVSKGQVDRGFLGLTPQALTPDLAAQFGAQRGVLVAEVAPDSPAEKAGLKTGDIITKMDDAEIRDPRQLELAVSQVSPDTKVKLEYVRDGKSNSATAKLDRRPDESLAKTQRRSAKEEHVDREGVLDGVGVTDLTPDIRVQLEIPSRIKGAIIAAVDPASPSARQGLREGDVILELDRKPVKNAEEAITLSDQIKGPKVVVLVWRQGQSRFLVIDESTG